MVEENWYGKFFFKSCGTLIWVRIIPVKVDWCLTGKICTQVIICRLDGKMDSAEKLPASSYIELIEKKAVCQNHAPVYVKERM